MAITRETLRLLAGMRISLGTDVDEVTAQTARAWASAWNDIRADIDNTIRDILTATDSGQRPSRALIDKVLRERDTLTIIRARLDKLAADSGIRVMQAIPTIVDRAAQFEAELIATQMPPGAGNTLAVTWNRVPADALTATTKPLPDLALDAIDAARNPAFKSPRILTTHRAPARPANPRAAQPPRVIDCGRCGQPDGVNHYCSTLRPTPTWHERRRELATHYGNLIAIAKRAHDHDTADLLRQQWSAALAELNTAMATHIGGGQ